jgi:hypothetical protein
MKKFLIVLSILLHLGVNTTPYFNATSAASDLKKRSKRPEAIRHGDHPNFFHGGVYNFYDKRIFFGRNMLGIPIRKKISEHAADNPEFGKVLLVLYYPNKKYKKQFVILGTYSNPIARKKLLRGMQTFFGYAHDFAIWCPEQNVIVVCKKNDFIISEHDFKVSKKFEQWLTSKK